MEKFTRRHFLELAAKSAPLLALAPSPRVRFAEPTPPSIPASEEKVTTIAQISGLHETPIGDGSLDLDLAFEHFKKWRVKHTTVINPTKRWLDRAASENMPFIARLHDENHNNLFDIDTFEKFAEPLKNTPGEVIVQLFNEITNPKEARGKIISIPDHTREHIIPAGKAAIEANLIPGIPPFDQTHNGAFEFRQTLETMVASEGAAWVRDNWVVIAHNYTFAPDQYIWRDLLRMLSIMTDVLKGGPLPKIHVSEAGPHHDFYDIYKERAFINETKRTLNEPIHYKLSPLIDTYDMWVYANGAQRRYLPEDGEMEKFEKTTYLGMDENGDVYEKPVAIAAALIKVQI